MKRRDEIEMTPEERSAYLEKARTIILCTIDGQGYPHAVAMWFCLIDGLVHMTTFRKAQKVVNLRRIPKAALLAESGTQYSELRGLLLRGRGEVIDDADLALEVLVGVQRRHGGEDLPGLRDLLRPQAAKRAVIRFHPERVASWDHSKLGGSY